MSPRSTQGFKSIPLSEELSDNRRMGPGRLTIIFSSSVAPVAGNSLTSGIMSSGKKCAEGLPRAAPHGAPALGGFACLHRRGHTPYCKSRMNYQRISEDKVQSLPRLRKSDSGRVTLKVYRRSGYSSGAKKTCP